MDNGTDGAKAPAAGAPDGTPKPMKDDLLRRMDDAAALMRQGHAVFAHRVMEQAAARIRELEAESEWRPIDEAAKKAGRVELYYPSQNVVRIGRWDEQYNYWSADQWFHERPPSHYRFLPKPPPVNPGGPTGRPEGP